MSRRPSPPTCPQTCGCDPLLLGRIEGTLSQVLQNQEHHGAKLEAVDARLRGVETKTAVFSAGMGAAAGLLMAVCVESVRGILRRS